VDSLHFWIEELAMTSDCRYPDSFDYLQDVICWGLGQIARPFDSPSLIKALLNGLRDTTGSVRADLMIYQSDMNILFFSETASADTNSPDQGKISIADTKNSAPVEALSGGHTVLVGDVRDSGLLSLSSGSRTLLAVPVIYGNRVHGVLNIEHALPDAYDAETVRWVEALSSLFAVLLEQSYLSEQLFRLNQKLIDQMTDNVAQSDPGYRAHAERVASIAQAIAKELKLDRDTVDAVRDSGFLHDVGKSGVSDGILVKPGKLTDDEMEEVKRHPVLGRFLLKPLGFQPNVIEGVASHHERWDGKGYPRGLEATEIPITGRILAVAEAYDVMTSDQPYRKKLDLEDALEDIRKEAGHQFDPEVVEALLRLDLSQF
jgi:putative nucleotidyltransferase with HDIG domain